MEPKRQRQTLTKYAQALSDCISTPPLGSSIFTVVFRVRKNTKKHLNQQTLFFNGAKMDPKVTLLGSRPYDKWVSFCFVFFALGGPGNPICAPSR